MHISSMANTAASLSGLVHFWIITNLVIYNFLLVLWPFWLPFYCWATYFELGKNIHLWSKNWLDILPVFLVNCLLICHAMLKWGPKLMNNTERGILTKNSPGKVGFSHIYKQGSWNGWIVPQSTVLNRGHFLKWSWNDCLLAQGYFLNSPGWSLVLKWLIFNVWGGSLYCVVLKCL